MNVELRDVYSNLFKYTVYLYSMLAERTPQQSISHKKLPTYGNHVKFVKNRPYEAWYIIYDTRNKNMVGNIYITKRGEIGLFIEEYVQGCGYGNNALELLFERHKVRPVYANINPANISSILFFQNNGFTFHSRLMTKLTEGTVLQETYILT